MEQSVKKEKDQKNKSALKSKKKQQSKPNIVSQEIQSPTKLTGNSLKLQNENKQGLDQTQSKIKQMMDYVEVTLLNNNIDQQHNGTKQIMEHFSNPMHPTPNDQIGTILLEDGKFRVWYVKMILSGIDTNFSIKYLLQFLSKIRLSSHKQQFYNYYNQNISKQSNNSGNIQVPKQLSTPQDETKKIQQHDNTHFEQKQQSVSKAIKRQPSNDHQKQTVKGSQSRPSSSKQKKFGSCYIYQIKQQKNSNRKQLIQRRTSARIHLIQNDDNKIQSATKTNNKSGQKNSSKGKKSNKKGISNEEQMINFLELQWIQNNFKQIDVIFINLDQTYQALTHNDQKLTRYLKNINQQSSKYYIKKSTKKKFTKTDISPNMDNNQTAFDVLNQLKNQENQQNFHQNKEEENIPLQIECVVDPNINNHGIFALLKLGKQTADKVNTNYAITNISVVSMANKRHIIEDLNTAAQLASVPHHTQLGYISLNSKIRTLLQQYKQRKNSNQNT